MSTYEYTVTPAIRLTELQQTLTEHDDKGWELVQVFSVSGEGTPVVAVLRRRYDRVT